MWQTTHTQITTASPAAIWQRWTNVAGWPEEDKNLEKAELHGSFAIGSKIILKLKGSPTSTVTLTEVNPNKSFAAAGKLPLVKILISHKIEPHTDRTISFTYTITVTGPLRGLFVQLFVQKMANDLPEKMQNIARLAEAS